MIEMALLEAAKQTDNKVRWDADVDGTRFSLYIPQWRVPTPWPERIKVSIEPVPGEVPCDRVLPSQIAQDSALANKSVEAITFRFDEKTKTVRYQPVGNPKDWEIGEPYIPYSMIEEESQFLRISVEWL